MPAAFASRLPVIAKPSFAMDAGFTPKAIGNLNRSKGVKNHIIYDNKEKGIYGSAHRSALGAQHVAAAPNKTNSTTTALSFPVGSGTLSNGTVFSGGNFVGTLTVTGFQIINGVLNAIGSLSGSLLDSLGNIIASVSNLILNIPVAVSGSCTILTLTLGPLDFNLLGLMVHLNQIVLTITAVTGNGNLLGDLLCAVANLLNNGGALQTLLSSLVSLLNQILAAL